jgi:hypothetical protein
MHGFYSCAPLGSCTDMSDVERFSMNATDDTMFARQQRMCIPQRVDVIETYHQTAAYGRTYIPSDVATTRLLLAYGSIASSPSQGMQASMIPFLPLALPATIQRPLKCSPSITRLQSPFICLPMASKSAKSR